MKKKRSACAGPSKGFAVAAEASPSGLSGEIAAGKISLLSELLRSCISVRFVRGAGSSAASSTR
jgi:hypothetical protein